MTFDLNNVSTSADKNVDISTFKLLMSVPSGMMVCNANIRYSSSPISVFVEYHVKSSGTNSKPSKSPPTSTIVVNTFLNVFEITFDKPMVWICASVSPNSAFGSLPAVDRIIAAFSNELISTSVQSS